MRIRPHDPIILSSRRTQSTNDFNLSLNLTFQLCYSFVLNCTSSELSNLFNFSNILQVLSPMQAILDYELSHNVPPGWVNNCISKTAPNGFWHRLERGELPMDSGWFSGFTSDLHNASLWKNFYSRARTTNPSLPSETPPVPTIDGEALFWSMMGGSREPGKDFSISP